ncbi:hypothetical protein E4U03_11725 [Rothia nasimurium]|uniref:Uncharacterized protein n=1 Tax=Rothia nasimurium TaxID=85336 RepID=A0A4Y9F0B6_9MICC|nr:hypothetical protein [Rothia nasimurium]MBF0809267.1 hypothetical protein [Rothia nasimurium]TFU20218.1 hypothetical protein E4U03_11725 [Rothia nasimurium]
MNREFSEEYMELMLAILEAAARVAVVTGRVVSQQVLKQSVKPAGWRPRNQKERDSHVAVQGKDGKTIGFVDKNSPLVQEIERRSDTAGAGGVSEAGASTRTQGQAAEKRTEQVETARQGKGATLASALAIGGAAFIGVHAARDQGLGASMSTGQVLSEAEARAYMEEAGWQWVDEGKPVMVEGKPAYVSGPGEVELVGGVDEVVLAEGHLVSERGFEGVDVKVAGHGTIGGEEIDAWGAEFHGYGRGRSPYG